MIVVTLKGKFIMDSKWSLVSTSDIKYLIIDINYELYKL